jgi:hypothetical protein
MIHVAADSDIFFYSISVDKRDRKTQLASGLRDHVDNHPGLELCVPFSVLAETVFKSLIREKEGNDPHKMDIIASLIELWRRLDIRFLPPTNRVAEIYWLSSGRKQRSNAANRSDTSRLRSGLQYGLPHNYR